MTMAGEGDKNWYGNANGNRNGDSANANLFAIPDFGRQPPDRLQQTLDDIGGTAPLFSLDIFDTAPHALPLLRNKNEKPPAGTGFFELPPLLSELAPLHGAPVRDIDSGIKKTQVNKAEPRSEPVPRLEEELPEDIWLCADDGLARPAEYRTWDKFDQPHDGQPPTVFITEAGPSAFDSLMASGRDFPRQLGSDVVTDAAYCACLLSLALGRSSVLFSWDAEKKSFVKTIAHLRTSGLSLKSVQCIDTLCLDCANAIKYLQSFSQTTYASASSPATFALAGVVDRLVLAILSELGIRSGRVRSILQLQAIVQPVHSVLSFFETLVTRLARAKTDEAMLSCLFQEVQSAEYRDGLLRELTCEVLRLMSKPWTDFVQEWIGLKVEEGTVLTKKGPGKSFVKIADRIWTDDQGFELEEPDFFLDDEKMPSFVPQDIAQAIFETGRNLRFLRDRHPEHPLSRQDVITRMRPPKLEWQFDWEGIAKLETRVNEYQEAVSLALHGNTLGRQQETGPPGSRNPNEYKLEFFGKSDDQIEANILASMGHLDQPPENREARSRLTALLRDRLYLRANGMVDDDGFSPHWSLVPLLSFGPIIGAQSRLVNHECMKLLFSAHNLRVHIDLLKQCYLLDNGVLCSRLSHALFDPDLETAERKSGIAFGGGVMGLRLGGRETWPPASSELRLVLMGVLSDSYNSPTQGAQEARPTLSPRSLVSDLPGDLSFAIRDLTLEEIDRCMNPDGVEALDFLQLSYKPPSPLRPIMSPTVLYKYDRIFCLLLRVLRMLYVVNQLFRFIPLSKRLHGPERLSNASVRFCIEARHFISQVAAFIFGTGISAPWLTFETWLNRVEAELSGDSETTLDVHNPADMSTKNCSPDMVRDRQEQVLDDIMLALFLRKRQQPVLKLLEEIFNVILRFAKQVRVRGPGGVEAEGKQDQAETAEKLYAAFREKVEVFLSVCKGLGEKTGVGGKSSSKADGGGMGGAGKPNESPFETLVLMLDMAGFYGKKASG
ncbi:Spc98 family-domain-containing protein [Podospora appendiculata]|uniref:Spindle pole body component n=1 Tax=Podospora appendiculata TaxID=314037 RepID=A0AAE1CC53_9PEZI|nr:Spc98 family-domain-containing protein [Podospora appendiculata]